MFPQVAPKFFTTRAEGPKNLSKHRGQAAAAQRAAPAAGGNGRGRTSQYLRRKTEREDAQSDRRAGVNRRP